MDKDKKYEYFMKVIIYEDQLPVNFTREDHCKFPTHEMHCFIMKEMLLKVNFQPAMKFEITDLLKTIEKKIRQQYNVYLIEYAIHIQF